MTLNRKLVWTALALCLCICWFVGGTWADSSGTTSDDTVKENPNVKIIDGQKVIVSSDQAQPAGKASDVKSVVRTGASGEPLSPSRLEYLQKLRMQALPLVTVPGVDDVTGGADPRGGVNGACCDAFSGTCSIRDETSCVGVGGIFLGDNTTCTPNGCPQPIDCDLSTPSSHVTQLPPDPANDPYATFISDVDANQLAVEGFTTSGGEITRVRWWGVEINGASNCNRANNNFDITFFADSGILGGGVATSPTPEIIAQYLNVTATRLKAENYALNGQQASYNGQLLWEYTVILPQRTAMLNGWVAIQATSDGTACDFRWMSHAFGPSNLFHNGQPVDDQTGGIQDVAVCINGSNTPVTGACCDDSVQGGSCQSNVNSSDCNDFVGGDHRFRVDKTCAQLVPTCGAITGSCCVGGDCSVVTSPECASQGGSFIAFEDCNPNICIGACCLGDGTCTELTVSDCEGQGGQHFGNGTLCSQTACPGTGRCCFDAGTSCEIRTEGACLAIGGARWDEGITCAQPCPVPPTNDLCATALPIECGQTITVDNTVATTEGSDPQFPCRVGGATQGVNSIWFTFVPTASSATIRTCNSLAPADDSIVQVFDGACGAFGTPLACNDDSAGCGGGLLSSVCVPNLIIGNTYYIEVAGWGAADIGPYAVEVVCPGLTCASTGACCLSSGGCAVLSEANCVNGGGTYGGDSTVCGTLGACCISETSCVLSNAECCSNASGAFLGEGTSCGAAAGEPQEFSTTANQAIPDDNAAGITNAINVGPSFTVGKVNVKLNITHTFVGDLCVKLEHNGTEVLLIQRMGADTGVPCHSGTPFGCGADNLVNIILDDDSTTPIESQCVANLTSPPNYSPFGPLSAFIGQLSDGAWNLTVSDNGAADTGTLVSWAVILDGVGVNPCDTEPGACCFSEGVGDCQLLNAIDCALAGGRFQGGGTACSGNICIPRGACCDNVTGQCQQLTQEDCQAIPTGNFLGDFSSCGACPIILGTCCNANGTCTENTTYNPCIGGGGSFTPGGNCDTTGACCFEDTSCLLTTQSCCSFAGGAYLGDGTNCGSAAGNPTDYTSTPGTAIGAAVANDSIDVVDSFSIGDVNVTLNITHTWIGDMIIDIEHNGTSVRIIDQPGFPVPDDVFGCDADNYNNIVLDDQGSGGSIEDQCVANLASPPEYTPNNPLSAFNGGDSAGTWNITITDTFAGADDGTLNSWTLSIDGIGINPCDTEPGACCFSEGINDCQLLNAVDCAQAGGRFQGGGSACSGDICIPRGACCNTFDGSCQRLTQEQCQVLPNSSFLGDFTSCGSCPIVLGACCLPDTSCIADIRVTQCDQLGGAFLPNTGCGEAAGNPTPYTSAPAAAILDNSLTTVTQDVGDNFTIGDLNVNVDITHTYIGDLEIDVIHGGTTVRLWDNQCVSSDNMNVTFSDGNPAVVCAAGGAATNGDFAPVQSLAAFNGSTCGGTWTLNVRDTATVDQGTLNTWTLIIDGIGINPCDSTPGACCLSETLANCQILDAVGCANIGGRFQGGGTSCTGDICIPRGACCNTITGACQQLTEEACSVSPNGNFLGDFTPCTQCPAVFGSCCLPNLQCIANTQFNSCDGQGGAFNPGGNCTTVGPCCLGDGTCNLATQACCLNVGGAYLGDGLNCGEAAGNPTPYTSSPGAAILDNTLTTVTQDVAGNFTIGDLDVNVDITHTYIGDLEIDVIHDGTTVRLWDNQCLSSDNMNVTFSDGNPAVVCSAAGVATNGNFAPLQSLAPFNGTSSSGTWTLNVRDTAGADQGTINSWTLLIDGVGLNPCDTDPGACCFSETIGDCQLKNAVDCATLGGRFQGGGTACAGTICQIRGACCDPVTGGCQLLPQAACASSGGNWLGGFTACGQCPIILGACCLTTGGCQVNTQFNACTAQGGAFLPNQNCGDSAGNPITYTANPNTAIPDNAPAGITSVINVPDSFTVGDVNVSISATHTWVGDMCISLTHGATTVDMIQRMGADTGVPCHSGTPFGCAEDNFNNVVIDDEGTTPIESSCGANLSSPPNRTPNNPLSAFDGQNSSGDWTLTVVDNAAGDTGTLTTWSLILDGVGINPCDQTPGACCVGQLDTDCSLHTVVECSQLGGRYQGANSACTPGICIIRGACCNTVLGTCQQLTQAECVGANLTYQGNFTNCATANCPQSQGACCLATGACQNGQTFAQCTTAGGNWEGANSTCAAVTGACCMGGEECLIATNACCTGIGGNFAGVGTNCGVPSGSPNTYSQTVNAAIPDNNQTGLTRTITVPDSFPVADVDVSVVINHIWVGDIIVRVTHNSVTRTIVNQIGRPAIDNFGCPQTNLNIRLDDEGTHGPIENGCSGAFGSLFATSPPNFTPNESFVPFDGMDSAGVWTIQVVDGGVPQATGSFVSWSLHLDHLANGACSVSTQCGTCKGDVSGDGSLNGKDVDPFTDCVLGLGGACPCGDMNNDTAVNLNDVPGFVSTLLSGAGPCGSVPVCASCTGDASGDGAINGKDCKAFVDCLLSTPNGCPCADMDGDHTVELEDLQDFVTTLLQNTGNCP